MKERDFDNSDDFDVEFETPDHDCPLSDLVVGLSMMPKPMGFIWNIDKIEKFLITRGYKILERYSESTGEAYKVAVKPGVSCIPSDNRSNLRNVFDEEVEDILLKWLVNLDK